MVVRWVDGCFQERKSTSKVLSRLSLKLLLGWLMRKRPSRPRRRPPPFLTEKSCDDDVQVRESDGEKGEEAEKVKMYSEVNLLVLVQ